MDGGLKGRMKEGMVGCVDEWEDGVRNGWRSG